jgi:hypothetical protein
MFKWHGDAEVCYAFLSDVDADEDPHKSSSRFRMSRWFTRGWTLQELIAPGVVYFYGADWKPIRSRDKFLDIIVQVTKISPTYFATGDLSQFLAAQKMSWAANRKTTRLEDETYCLLGLFDINMPLVYGEGERAFQRLQEEILPQSEVDSLFVHNHRVILATSPSQFRHCGRVLKWKTWPYTNDPTLTLNRNQISMGFPVAEVSDSEYATFCTMPWSNRPTSMAQAVEQVGQCRHGLALLNCGTSESTSVLLLREESPGVFSKVVFSHPTAWIILEPIMTHRVRRTTISISRALKSAGNGTWDWRAGNNLSLAREALQNQMRLDFEGSFGGPYARMKPIVRPALPHGGWAGGSADRQSVPQNDALDKLRDKVVIKGPCRDSSGFQLQYVHVADFRFTWLERGNKIHLVPYQAGVKGQPCFIFPAQQKSRSWLPFSRRELRSTRRSTHIFLSGKGSQLLNISGCWRSKERPVIPACLVT